MPGAVKSTDLARKAKKRLPDVAVLFTSGYTQNAIVHSGRLDDGVELISKPYTRERLAQKVRKVLDGRPPSAPFKVPAATPAPVAPREKRKLRILLVEDEVIVRMTTADILTDMGHHVLRGREGQRGPGDACGRTDRRAADRSRSAGRIGRGPRPRYAGPPSRPDNHRGLRERSADLFTDEKARTRVRHLTKPFGEASLASILREG
jgi:CheY-like chemotaxis protein